MTSWFLTHLNILWENIEAWADVLSWHQMLENMVTLYKFIIYYFNLPLHCIKIESPQSIWLNWSAMFCKIASKFLYFEVIYVQYSSFTVSSNSIRALSQLKPSSWISKAFSSRSGVHFQLSSSFLGIFKSWMFHFYDFSDWKLLEN